MARGSATHVDEALDLFLDTISNVFGGIIFIALLVVLLLQITPEDPTRPAAPPPDAAAATELEAQISALERITGGDDAEARAEMVSLLGRQRELKRSVDAAHARVESLRTRAAEARLAATDVANEIDRSAQTLAAAQAELERARAQSAGRLRVPRFRPTGKQEHALLLAGGRIAPLLAPTGSLNAEDVEVVDSDSRVRLKPGGGNTITEGNVEEIVLRLAPADNTRGYVSLAVWPDSYKEATLLRDAFIARGIDYNLVLLPEGGAVKTAASSGVQ